MKIENSLMLLGIEIDVLNEVFQGKDNEEINAIKEKFDALAKRLPEMSNLESLISNANREEYNQISAENINRYKTYNKQLGALAEQIDTFIVNHIQNSVTSNTLVKEIITHHQKESSFYYRKDKLEQGDLEQYKDILRSICTRAANQKSLNELLLNQQKIKFEFMKDMILLFINESDGNPFVKSDPFQHQLEVVLDIEKRFNELDIAIDSDTGRNYLKSFNAIVTIIDAELANVFREIMNATPKIDPSKQMINIERLDKYFARDEHLYDAKKRAALLNEYKMNLADIQQSILLSIEEKNKSHNAEIIRQIPKEQQIGAIWSLREIVNNYKEGDFIYGLSQGRAHLVGILDPQHDNMTVTETGELKVKHMLMIDDLNHGFLGTGHADEIQENQAKGIGFKYDNEAGQRETGVTRKFHDFLVEKAPKNIEHYSTEEYVNFRIKLACKNGVYFVTKELGNNIHFVLDGINMDWVVNKTGPSDLKVNPATGKPYRDITGAELRFIFRNRLDPELMKNVKFWKNGKLVSPPWETDPRLWVEYSLTHNASIIASKLIEAKLHEINFHLQQTPTVFQRLKLQGEQTKLNRLLTNVTTANRLGATNDEILSIIQRHSKDIYEKTFVKLERNNDLTLVTREQKQEAVSVDEIRQRLKATVAMRSASILNKTVVDDLNVSVPDSTLSASSYLSGMTEEEPKSLLQTTEEKEPIADQSEEEVIIYSTNDEAGLSEDALPKANNLLNEQPQQSIPKNPIHPAHPLFVLLESIDLSNEDDLIRFAQENQKFQLQIQDGLLRTHINRLRVKDGKEAKDVMEIGADDAVPFRMALIADYLSKLEKAKADELCEKMADLAENFFQVLDKQPQKRKGSVVLWGEEHGFLTGVESAFTFAQRLGDYKIPEDEDIKEAIVTIRDQESLEYFAKLQDDKFKVLLQINTSIREIQRTLDKENDPEKRKSYQIEIDNNITLFKAQIKENPDLLQKQDAAGHNILYYVAKESPNPIIVEFLINNGCDVAKMGVTKNDIEADYLVDRKGNPVQFIGYDGEEREMTLNERLLQLKNPSAFDGYRIQRVLPKIQAFIDSNDVDGLRALFSTRECSGINPNHAVNAKYDTLMHLVCRANNPEMIHFFLRHEFDNGREVKFNVKNEDGNHSFELMADTASTQALKQGMKHIYEQEFLVKCIKEKSLDEFAVELQKAIDNGFELNGKYSAKGENLLHLCVQVSNTIGEEKFKALLEHLHAKGADFNAKDKAGETPLFKAAQTPSFLLEAFKLMIDQYQADPDVLSLKNRSILISALVTGRSNSAISDYMLNRFEQTGKLYTTESGENIRYLSLPDQDGLTAMHYALDQNNTQLIDKLLEQDFDLTLDLEDWINYEGRKKSDRIGYSVLHLAAEKCSPEFFEKILNKYKEQLQVQFIRENLHLSVDARDQQFEELFKERINELDGQIGFTLLHAALNNHNNKDIIEILKKNGASLTEENTATGQSYSARAMIPFGKAIVNDQPFDVSSKLISPEMLSMHFSNQGRTPLMMVLDSLIGKTNVQVKDAAKKSDGQEKQTKNSFVLGKASNIEVNSQLLAHIMQMSEDSAVYKQADATGNTPLHYAMRILATTLTDKQRKPVLEMISKCLNAGVGLDNQNVDGKSPLDLLAEAATGHFKHDMLPKKLYDELQAKGADPHGPLFEEYSISSFTEPFVILSEKRETTLLAEMLKAQNIDNYLAFIQSEIERDPSLNAKIADALLTPNASGSTVLGDLFQKSESNQAAINFALQCVDKKDKRFANVVCDEIPIDSPYLDLGNEDFLKKWLKQGLNINHQGEKTGNTLLHKRFQQGDSYDVATLLRQGANPKIKNHDGDTARASKPDHSISVPVVMNYAVRYAAKSVANGAKRVWRGVRGKRSIEPSPTVQVPVLSPIVGIKQGLATLDNEFTDMKFVAQAWKKGRSFDIPKIPLNSTEKKKLKAAQKTVEELEAYINTKYQSDFNALVWHGASSLERIVWQDDKIISALSDPLVIKAILLNAQESKESKLGTSNSTLSSLILSSISAGKLSYMTSVAPNWMNKPKVEGVDWRQLKQMGISGSAEENPFIVTAEYLTKVQTALANTQHVLKEIHGDLPVKASLPNDNKLNQLIDSASNAELIDMIAKILVSDNVEKSANTIEILTSGVAGTSTLSKNMNEQCLEVIAQYQKLLAHHNGDDVKVLGYGLVSHAVDAKHLIAAMYYLNQQSDLTDPGQIALKQFLERIKTGLSSAEADSLMNARLKQIMVHILSNRQKIELSDDKLFSLLKRVEPVAPEVEKKRGVRFADDSVEETAEKKPLEQRAEVKEVRTYQKGDEQGLSSEALDKATALLKEQPKKSILKKPKQESDALDIVTPQAPRSAWQAVKPTQLKSPTSLSSHQPITPMSNGHKKHKVADMVQPIAKLSPTAAAAEVCVQEFQQALKELQAGKLPDFCQADVPLRVARQACIDILKKIDDLEKTNKLAPSDIRVIAFEVGAGRVLKKENPLSELRTKIETIESMSKSKLKPGGNPASSA